MSSAITTMPAQAVAQMDFATKLQAADYLLKSGFLPSTIKTPQQVVTIMMYADELGVGYMQALNGINVIQGKPSASPQLMLALINRSGKLENMRIDATDTGCSVMMKRVGRDPHTETFTRDDAKAMGLLGKDNYTQQPRVMLKWRAVAACARVVFPDVIQGMYTPEELGADVHVSDEGDMTITVTPEVVLPHVPTLTIAPSVAPVAPSAAPNEPTPAQITRAPYAGTWYDDASLRGKYETWLRGEGLIEGQDTGLTGKQPWDYADGKSACEAVKAAKDARDAELRAPIEGGTIVPPSPDVGDLPPAEFIRSIEAPQSAAHAGERWAHFVQACDEYLTTPERMMELTGDRLPEEYSSVGAMRGAVHNAALKKQLEFRPTTMRYEKSGNGKKLVVSAPGQIGTFTIFGGRESLSNLLAGDAAVAAAALGMDAWNPPQTFDAKALHGLVFSWRIEKREGKDARVISKARWSPSAQDDPQTTTHDPLALNAPPAPSASRAEALFDALGAPTEEGELIPS